MAYFKVRGSRPKKKKIHIWLFRMSVVGISSRTCSLLNPLTANGNYSGRTAPLTSKVAFYIFIQQILVLNIFKIVYTLHFFLFKMQFVS